jgi:hypothetical protein
MPAGAAMLPGELLLLVTAAAGGLLALGYLLWPALRTYRELRGTLVVTCPDGGAPAAVALDALAAAAGVSAGRGPVLGVEECSRWPEHRGCGQGCLAEIERAPTACLARTMLASWYGGKACVLCGRPFGEIDWLERKPALLAPRGITVEWREVPAETLPGVLSTHSPVCWSCHIAETFRRRFPELVTDRPWRTP